jgi:hypothetical protein
MFYTAKNNLLHRRIRKNSIVDLFVKKAAAFMEPKASLPHSEDVTTVPCTEPN